MLIEQSIELLKTPQFILAAIIFGIPFIIFQIAMFFSISERGRAKVLIWIFSVIILTALLLLFSPYIINLLNIQ